MSYGICQRCGWKKNLSDMAKEWTGLRVCKNPCFDPKPKQLSPPSIGAEGVPLPTAAPEPADIFLTDNQVTPDSL